MPPRYGLALFQSVMALAAACVAAWAVLRWAARRGPVGLRGGAGRHGTIRVLDRAMLDTRRSVYLVQVGARVLLLGGGDTTVTVLAEFREDELGGDTDTRKPGGEVTAFADVLARLRGGGPR